VTTAPRTAAAPEPPAEKWKRRRVTIPTMLGATAATLILAPIIVPTATVWDALRLRWRFPTIRVYLFVTQYLINDTVEILAAGPLWILAGFGSTLDSPTSRRRHQRLQAWSIAVLARRAQRLLGVRIDTDPDINATLTPGPAIVVCRHVSLFDASLPSLLYHQLGYHTRGVIMAELLADPGFDLLYQRAGSVFIPRDNNPDAIPTAATIGVDLDERTVAVIFPEGRLYRSDILARSLERLAERDPERAQRLTGLAHLLPPRPGGLNALLDTAPTADVVVINHAGLDRYPAFADIARHAPLDRPIRVNARRIAREAVPADHRERTTWLDALWLDMDRWVDEQLQ
jgi:1-acyl-sn-glycerol-3-phosphate acyltransferase